MKLSAPIWSGPLLAALLFASVAASPQRIDLSKEQVGKPPATFEPIVGTWLIAQDGPDKVVMVDGRPWVASKDNPIKFSDRAKPFPRDRAGPWRRATTSGSVPDAK